MKHQELGTNFLLRPERFWNGNLRFRQDLKLLKVASLPSLEGYKQRVHCFVEGSLLLRMNWMIFEVLFNAQFQVSETLRSWLYSGQSNWNIWVSRRLLRVPWTARRSNQSILKEISPGISLEGMVLKLNLQYFGHLMWRVDSLETTLMLGGIGGRRRRGRQRMRRWMASLTRWTWVWVNSGSWWWTGRPGMLRFMGSQRVGHNWADWTELNWTTPSGA